MKQHRLKKRYTIGSALLVVLAFAVVATTTAVIKGVSYVSTGVAQLERGQSLLLEDPVTAEQAFKSASASFTISSGILLNAPWYAKILTPLPPFRWYVQLIRSSRELAEIGKVSSELVATFPSISLKQTDISALLKQATTEYTTWESQQDEALDTLTSQLTIAHTELQNLPSWVFFARRSEIEHLKQTIGRMERVIPQVRDASQDLQRVLGKQDDTEREVVIFFQNSAELRPCGGFPGSFATLTARHGKIVSFEFGKNIYKFDRAYENSNGLIPPPQFQTINPFFSSANACVADGFLNEYGPRVLSMFSEATNTKPVGSIYINSTVLEGLLQITGPVTLPNGSTASAETIGRELTTEIEKNYFENPANVIINEPKSILNDLIPILLQRVSRTEQAGFKLASLFEKSLKAKEVQLWFIDSALQNSLSVLLPKDTPSRGKPWMKLVNSNIGGMKSSQYVEQETSLHIDRGLLRGAENTKYTLKITRKHTGTGEWPDSRNRNYLTLYLPPESQIVEKPTAIGGEYSMSAEMLAKNNLPVLDQSKILEEKTVDWKRVGWWATTNPGETTTYTISFTLPSEAYPPESITYLKQSGSKDTLIYNKVQVPVDRNVFLDL